MWVNLRHLCDELGVPALSGPVSSAVQMAHCEFCEKPMDKLSG